MAAATLVAGLLVRSGVLPKWWAKYLGVALWCTLVYWLVVLVRPTTRVRTACVIAVVIGWAVELAQLTPGPAWLARAAPISRWVFGTTFNAPDLVAYVVGAGGAALVHVALERALGRRGASER